MALHKPGSPSKKISPPKYDSVFLSNQYHVINGLGLEKAKFNILPNTDNYNDNTFPVARHAPNLGKYSTRLPIASPRFPPNEHRFDLIEKNPAILTRTKQPVSMHFGKMLGRQIEKTIYRMNPYNAEYDNVEAQKLNTMPKIQTGLVGMGK